MKLIRKLGATSQILQIFVADSSSTTGAGLTGLTNSSSGLTAYYHRDTDTTATAISLVTMTVGTFTSSGFKEIDSTNMPGWYQFCPPNAALASGAASVGLHLKGATNMAPLPIEIDLDAQVDVTSWNGTAVSSPATAGIPDVNVKNMNNVAATSITTVNANQGTTQPLNFTGTGGSALTKADTIDIGGTAQTARDIGASVLLSVGTGTGQVNLTSGKVPATLASTDVTGNVAADLQTIKTQTVTCAGGVTVPAATLASTTNITAGTITTATNLTNAPTSGDLTATMKASVTTACTASTPTAAAVTGAVGSVTGNVGGNVTGSVGSVVAAVAITSNRKKGATATFAFTMTDSTTGADKTGLTVGSVISLDGGSFASTTNSVTEIGDGYYQLVLTAGEMTANNVALQMTATGATNRDISIQTQP